MGVVKSRSFLRDREPGHQGYQGRAESHECVLHSSLRGESAASSGGRLEK
jgi:hypothetical protein